MATSQNSLQRQLSTFSYKLAELKRNKDDDWRIVFYVLNPATNKLVRKRVRVKKMANQKVRLQFAKKAIQEINEKLIRGWNPILMQEAPRSFSQLSEILTKFQKQIENDTKTRAIRPDTLRTYKSYINNILKYIAKKFKNEPFAIHFDRKFVLDFLEHIYFERGNSARTHNNYLMFLRLFSKYLLQREYISKNPTEGVSTKKVNRKTREVIPFEIRQKINNYLEKTNHGYLTLCLLTYFCFIRRTEATKLKVKHFNLNEGYIVIPDSISKNGKTESVTIPRIFEPYLREHLKKGKNQYFVFSGSMYKPGAKALHPKSISVEWDKMRRTLRFAKKYQFYSLKDTGITELLNTGIPAIKVRDQARHHDLKITESYTSRNNTADSLVRQTGITF